MDIRDYIRVLRTRWRLLVACVLLGVAVAAVASSLTPRIYEANAELFVSTTQSTDDSGSTLNQGGQFAQNRVKSYAQIVNSPAVTGPVVRDLGLSMSGSQLSGLISAVAPLNTVLIDVSVRDGSPQQAQRIVNAVAVQFTQVVGQLETPTDGGAPNVKVSVVKPSDVPGGPVAPRTRLNLGLGLLVGLAFGVGAGVLRETLDTTIKNPVEVQDLLGVSTLGVIAFDAGAAQRPLIVQDDPRSTRAEAFRQLRTNLQFVDVDSPPRSIAITSALPQDGKSTTACNLAIALAQSGLRIALVETDLRRPRLAEYLGLEGAVGLTDVLVGRAGLEDVLQHWGTDDLVVLPSGPTPPNPSELLGSQHMQTLLTALESRFDLVLLDATPLLPVTDAAIVAAQASGTIVILRVAKTTRDQASRAVDLLRRVDARIYGVVLNMAPTKGPGATRYGYGYGYGYGYASSPPAQREPVGAEAREPAEEHVKPLVPSGRRRA